MGEEGGNGSGLSATHVQSLFNIQTKKDTHGSTLCFENRITLAQFLTAFVVPKTMTILSRDQQFCLNSI